MSLVQDPEGKPLPATQHCCVEHSGQEGWKRAKAVTMVFGGFIAQAGVPGAYGAYGAGQYPPSTDGRTPGPDGKSMINETWQAKGQRRELASIFKLEFERGVPARNKVEAKVHSAAKPSFYRMYRFEQAADVGAQHRCRHRSRQQILIQGNRPHACSDF